MTKSGLLQMAANRRRSAKYAAAQSAIHSAIATDEQGDNEGQVAALLKAEADHDLQMAEAYEALAGGVCR